MAENKNTEVKKFDAEIGKVLKLMIHSLYTNKEIFLRELISNSSDACDKLRYLSLEDSSLISEDPNFKISIAIEKDSKIIRIKDNGIGMSFDELVSNLGTIAKSGTQNFLNQFSDDAKKNSDLIGQFGVGFYSVFMVADYVKVVSVSANDKDKKAYIWESDGLGEYKVSEYSGEEKIGRGTEVTIHLKQDEESFLDHFRIKHIIKSYSDHISVPIFYYDENSKNEVQVNSGSAIWTRNKSDISEQEYQDFYKNVAHAGDKPWIMMHNRNEGAVEFINLLFVPEQKTYDLFHPDRRRRVKLYIKKVFITDENIEIIPRYLRFLRGVVDCQDLPLNISRETLQHNPIIDKIRNSITKRFFSEIKKKQNDHRDEYVNFWKNFGAAIKEGLCEHLNVQDHEMILESCIFKSALTGQYISFDEYIANISDTEKDKKTIYYIGGDSETELLNSPQIEGLLANNVDVLLFTDTVDDFFTSVVSEYRGYEIKSVSKFDKDKEEKSEDDKSSKESHEDLCKYFKETLGNKVKEVKISSKLTQSPVCLSIPEMGMDTRMEKMLLEHGQIKTAAPKILEINIENKIIKKIDSDLSNGIKNDDLVAILFAEASILSGEQINNPSEFSKMLNRLIEKGI